MRFLVLLYPGEHAEHPGPRDPTPHAALRSYSEELARAGVLLSVDGLEASASSVCIRFPEGKATVVDGPHAAATAAVGGYWLLQVKSRAEAIEWAKRCPAREPAVLELRQVLEPLELAPRPADNATRSDALAASRPAR
jgi:hypothetical protein